VCFLLFLLLPLLVRGVAVVLRDGDGEGAELRVRRARLLLDADDAAAAADGESANDGRMERRVDMLLD